MKPWIALGLAIALTGCRSEESGIFDAEGLIEDLRSNPEIQAAAVSEDHREIFIGLKAEQADQGQALAAEVCAKARQYAAGQVDNRTIRIMDVMKAVDDEEKVELNSLDCALSPDS